MRIVVSFYKRSALTLQSYQKKVLKEKKSSIKKFKNNRTFVFLSFLIFFYCRKENFDDFMRRRVIQKFSLGVKKEFR